MLHVILLKSKNTFISLIEIKINVLEIAQKVLFFQSKKKCKSYNFLFANICQSSAPAYIRIRNKPKPHDCV